MQWAVWSKITKLFWIHCKKTCSHAQSLEQKRKSKVSNIELMALNLTAEYMTLNTELQLFRAMKGSYLDNKIERNVYNKIENTYLCNSQRWTKWLLLILQLCQYVKSVEQNVLLFVIKPAWGYCVSQKIYYFNCKIHAVCNEYAVIHSFEFTPANIRDIHYLKDVKNNNSNCELIGDKEYFSAYYQLDLFTSSRIELQVPMRENQHDFTP